MFVNTAIERASADKDIAALKAFQKRKDRRGGCRLPSKGRRELPLRYPDFLAALVLPFKHP